MSIAVEDKGADNRRIIQVPRICGMVALRASRALCVWGGSRGGYRYPPLNL